MRIIKKVTAMVMAVTLTLPFAACGARTDTAKNFKTDREVTVTVWYDDENYTKYLNHIAEQFHKANEFVTITPVYKSEEGFLNAVYDASIHEEAPDVYLMNGKDMEYAYLYGLIEENDIYMKSYSEAHYPVSAINAACWNETLYGYPVTFDTAFMVYNKDYVSSVEDFDALTSVMNEFQLKEGMEQVTLIAGWDTSSLMLNYPFVGGYLNPGGTSAENKDDNAVSDNALLSALTAYAGLRENYAHSFSLDEDDCIKRFQEGSLLYTLTTTKKLKELNDSKVSYGVCAVPASKQGFGTESLSETTLAMVNGYSDSVEAAKAVAKAISYDYADLLEDYTGYISARKDVTNKTHEEAYANIYDIYGKSDIHAKYAGAQTVYLKLETLLKDVWEGRDVAQAWQEFNH